LALPHEALVVDDDPAARYIYQHVLTPVGFNVTTAADGAEAMEKLQAQSYKMVVLDLLLPLVSGRDIVDYIQQAPHLRDTHILIASAHLRLQESIPLRDRDSFMVKPISPRLIRDVARQVLATASSRS
jgi:CheY-like chemotaxis protein